MSKDKSRNAKYTNESTPLVTHSPRHPPLLRSKPFLKIKDFLTHTDFKMDYQVDDQLMIFRLNGSIWPRVLPWCIFNTSIAFLVRYCHHYAPKTVDFSFESSGLAFIGVLVSFLVIARSNKAYYGWIGSKNRVRDLNKNFRQLSQLMATFTRHDNSSSAAKWRFEVCRRAIILLRVIVAVLEHDKKEQQIWQLSELTCKEKKAILHSVGGEIERAPVILALFLRTAIGSHVKYLKKPLDVNEELSLIDCTAGAMSSYYTMMMSLNTVFPFPLEQMGRTIVFVYVFTLPFSLEAEITSTLPFLSVIFILTYGFMGLELLNMELGDPFGDTPLFVDYYGLASVVFDDIYIAIHDVDGKIASSELKNSIKNPVEYEESTMKKDTVHSHALGDWYEKGGEQFVDAFPIEAFANQPHPRKNSSFRGISARNLFSNIFSEGHEDEEGEIDIFGSDEKISIDLPTGIVKSKVRSWSNDYKQRRSLY